MGGGFYLFWLSVTIPLIGALGIPSISIIYEVFRAISLRLLTRTQTILFIGINVTAYKEVHFAGLRICFNLNPRTWGSNLAVSNSVKVSTKLEQQVSYFAAFATILLAICFSTVVFVYNLFYFKFLSIILVFLSVFVVYHELFRLKLNTGFFEQVQLENGLLEKFNLKKFICSGRANNNEDYNLSFVLLEQIMIRQNSDQNSKILTKYLRAAVLTGHYSEAIKAYKDYCKGNIFDSNDYFNLGVAFASDLQFTKALEFFQLAKVDFKDNVNYLINLGFVYSGLEEFDKAIENLNNALTKDNSNLIALINRAFCYLETGKLDKAKKDIDRSIEIDPKNSYSIRNEAIFYLKKSELIRALELLERVKNIDPKTLLLDDLLNEVKEKLGEIGNDDVLKK